MAAPGALLILRTRTRRGCSDNGRSTCSAPRAHSDDGDSDHASRRLLVPRRLPHDLSKPLPPRAELGLPTEFALGLGIRSPPDVRHHHDEMLTSNNSGQPCRNVERRLGAMHLSERRQPFAHRRRLIVHDVVDTACLSTFDGENRRPGGIVDLYERPPAVAITDYGRTTSPDLLHQWAVEHPRIQAVEGAVAQNNAFGFAGSGNRAFEISDRIECTTQLLRRLGIERIRLRFDWSSHPRIRPAAETLRDETSDAGLSGRYNRLSVPCVRKRLLIANA